MSTLLPGLVLGALLLISTRGALTFQPATTSTPVLDQHDRVAGRPGARWWLHAIRGSPLPPNGEIERAIDVVWSPAARLGLGFQPPRKIATGQRGRIRLHHRFRSAVLLVLLVLVGGSVLAGVVGLLLFAASFLVEQAIG